MQGTDIAMPVRDTGDALRASLAGALNTLLSAIPRVIGFALVLIVGWFLATLLAKAVRALLHAMRFNDLARRSGFAGFVQKMGVRQDSAGVIASLAKWFVRLIALVVAFDTAGLPAVSGVLQQLLLWLPNVVVGLIVLVIGGLLANALANLVRGTVSEARIGNPDVLATVARTAVWALAIVIAVSQLGIATVLINTLVIGVVAAVSLACGLAFGLGGRDRAAEILARLGARLEEAGPRLERAVGVGRDAEQAIGLGDDPMDATRQRYVEPVYHPRSYKQQLPEEETPQVNYQLQDTQSYPTQEDAARYQDTQAYQQPQADEEPAFQEPAYEEPAYQQPARPERAFASTSAGGPREGWVQRSGYDRRRVPRPGPDRRGSEPSAA